MMHRGIVSVQNKSIQSLFSLLQKSKKRKNSQFFFLEGEKEISLALKGNYQIQEVFYCKKLLSENFDLEKIPAMCYTEVSLEIYKKVTYRSTTEGVFAIVKKRELSLDKLTFETDNPLILVLDSPEKPGNIGAVLRTADAAKIDAVLISNFKSDIFNPNTIRASLGCLFTVNIAVSSMEKIISFLERKNITMYAAAIESHSKPYHKEDYTSSTAFILGTESEGLSEKWLENVKKKIKIPMFGKIDAMNLSVVSGILTYEAKRQRNFK